MKKLFIGKLSFSTTETSLRALFAQYEPLKSVKVISDKMTGRSRGFGFIEVEDSSKADQAIATLDGALLDGRNIAVGEARPQTEGSRSSGGYRSNDRDSFSRDGNRGGGY
jgi:cold-inducible RNA-binding protein